MTNRIVIVGAGSMGLARQVMADILWHDALRACELALVDPDAERLEVARAAAVSIRESFHAGARIETFSDWPDALEGARVVINLMRVGGAAAARLDLDVPLKHGLKQLAGDAIGVGGIFRAVRTIPEFLRLCEDMQKRCPDALLLSGADPAAMLGLAAQRTSRVRCVGVCADALHTSQAMRMFVALHAAGVSAADVNRHLKRRPDAPERLREWREWWAMGDDHRLDFACSGVSPLAFFTRLESDGKDIYPALRRVLSAEHLRLLDPVRFDLLERLGWFMTAVGGRAADAVPFYLRDPREMRRMGPAPAGFYPAPADGPAAFRERRRSLQAKEPMIRLPYAPSGEYAGRIVNAVVTNRPFVFNGCVPNDRAWVPNLPVEACVEVPCRADAGGVTPQRVAPLPAQCAALARTHYGVQDLTVRGILEGNRDRVCQAALLDPNASGQLTPAQVWDLCAALFRAHARYLPKRLARPGKRE